MAEVKKIYNVPKRGVGMPDYASPKPLGQVPVGPVYTLSDLSELAARIGSIDSFDRRGNVIWLDDFESSLNKWEVLYTTPPAAAAISTERARNGGNSALLTTGDTLGSLQAIRHNMPIPYTSKMGFEFSFAYKDNVDYVFLEIYFRALEYSHHARIRLNFGVVYPSIYDQTQNYVEVPTRVYLPKNSYLFHTCKLVVDFLNQKYDRLIINAQSIDISDYQYYVSSPTDEKLLGLTIKLSTEANASANLYADDVIITQNEP